ncbi:cef modifier of supressor tRNAs [Acinetobacter phage Acj9]|uniref:Cef modifier of suppressor tRNAs n=1 Tax=Acinetobacter phage Acj9 TaxID=760939 RepID=E5EPF3_9CAUD|nr:cef modifier of supressor tRNAs [Acinetobacter phage Acj9]ADG59919.1 hypothetical protein Acj9p019 [Acinetobacter phage Acj9]
MSKANIIKAINRKPVCTEQITITQEEFDAVLMNPELCVVEKHFHGILETNQVLFVVDEAKETIEQVYVKNITDKGTYIYKEA